MPAFISLTLAIAAASLFGFLARLIRQPLLAGYLIAGIVLGTLGFFGPENAPILESLAQIGVTLLLFLVGLEMNLRELPQVGRVALWVGAGQIIVTTVVGFFLALGFGFSPVAALYLGLALTFSSTIVVVKLLSEKKDLSSLYGKITVGILLLQDLVAILLLIFLSGFQAGEIGNLTFFWVMLRGFLLLAGVALASRYILRPLFDKISTLSTELLFIASLGWALLMSVVVSGPPLGFSLEIGGFLAGLALANSAEHLQIAARVRPLRDFFVTLFFLLVGAKMVVGFSAQLMVPAVVFSLFVLLGKPLIVLTLGGFLGYKARTSFLAGVSLAQISEFSLILVALGVTLGQVDGGVSGVVAMVGVVTFLTSTYFLINNHRLWAYFGKTLLVFQRESTHEAALAKTGKMADIILFGGDRTGRAILSALDKSKSLLVVDFNPSVVERLTAEGYAAVFGDAADPEFLEEIDLGRARTLVSTMDSREDDLGLLEKVKSLKKQPATILVASSPGVALELYEAGADYVVVPRVLGGAHIVRLLAGEVTKETLARLRDRHFDRLVKERF